MTAMVQISPPLPTHATPLWLAILPACDMVQFRRKIRAGGKPIFLPDESSVPYAPCWRLLVQDGAGDIWRVTTAKAPLCRNLTSIQRVYQVARDAGLTELYLQLNSENPGIEKVTRWHKP